MITLNKVYIDGAFVTPHGTDTFDLISPVDNTISGTVTLGDEEDVRLAVAAAKRAFTTFSKTTKEERIAILQKMHDAIAARRQEFIQVMVEEYGGTLQFCTRSADYALDNITSAINTLWQYDLVRVVGQSQVQMTPVGVAGIITPWNSSNGFITGKLSAAIAAGCTAVIKPSEMSARQTQLMMECLHEAALPAGVVNIVNGLGAVVGAEIVAHPDIAKISFTGSTVVGKYIAREAAGTLKRITLELGGKSPNILLDDADLNTAVPMAVAAAFMNSGQACIAGTRLLVHESKVEEVEVLLKAAVEQIKTGRSAEDGTVVGPMVNRKQYERVRAYIKSGIEEGATLLTGGLESMQGLEEGNFVRPTVFTNVTNNMRIAREEIFGPVLCVITYKDDDDAIAIANDTTYGLQAYVNGKDKQRIVNIARQLNAGRVMINCLKHDPEAPFGGFKQSGIGREFGIFGLESYLEPKTILE
jgi:aldehyde dehydrogenase (NAD+)